MTGLDAASPRRARLNAPPSASDVERVERPPRRAARPGLDRERLYVALAGVPVDDGVTLSVEDGGAVEGIGPDSGSILRDPASKTASSLVPLEVFSGREESGLVVSPGDLTPRKYARALSGAPVQDVEQVCMHRRLVWRNLR